MSFNEGSLLFEERYPLLKAQKPYIGLITIGLFFRIKMSRRTYAHIRRSLKDIKLNSLTGKEAKSATQLSGDYQIPHGRAWRSLIERHAMCNATIISRYIDDRKGSRSWEGKVIKISHWIGDDNTS